AVNASPFLLSRALRDVELTIRGESPDPQDDDYPGFLLARAIRSEVRSGSGLDGDRLTHLLAGMAFMGLESADLDYHAQRMLAAEAPLDRHRRIVADGLATGNDWPTDDPSLRDI